jgi:hypothetical protein
LYDKIKAVDENNRGSSNIKIMDTDFFGGIFCILLQDGNGHECLL